MYYDTILNDRVLSAVVGNGPRAHPLLKIQQPLLLYDTIDNGVILQSICYSLNDNGIIYKSMHGRRILFFCSSHLIIVQNQLIVYSWSWLPW